MRIHAFALLSMLALASSTSCRCGGNKDRAGGDRAAIDVECNGNGDHVECVARSTGTAQGKGCFSLVAHCSDGMHSTHVCSAVLGPGKEDTITVPLAALKPAIRNECKSIRVEHLVVTER